VWVFLLCVFVGFVLCVLFLGFVFFVERDRSNRTPRMDRLAGGDSLLSHGWFRTMEECFGAAGTPVLPDRSQNRRPGGRHATALGGLAADMAEPRSRAVRTLCPTRPRASGCKPFRRWCVVSVACPDAAVLMRPGLPIAEREQIQRLLVERAEHLAQTHGYTLCFPLDRSAGIVPRRTPRHAWLPAGRRAAHLLSRPAISLI